jgi:hypothetical protein
MRTRVLLLAALGLCACDGGGSAAERDAGGADTAPVLFRVGPLSKMGDKTADGCAGVSELGECQGLLAVTCDVRSARQLTVRCDALGQNCVVDDVRGASCTDRPQACEGLVSVAQCDGDVLVWCDEAQMHAWNCADSRTKCLVDDCRPGPFCCAPEPPTGADGGADPCYGLDDVGVCGDSDNQLAMYCLKGEIIRHDCVALGRTCLYNVCAPGAECCLPCERGSCSGTTLTYCQYGGPPRRYDCGRQRQLCAVEACSPDLADCCPPTCDLLAHLGLTSACTGNTAVRCVHGSLVATDCNEDNELCVVDEHGEASCQTLTCAAVGHAGVCVNNRAYDCLLGYLATADCNASGQICGVDLCAWGQASCCPATCELLDQIGEAARCSGNTLFDCSTGELITTDCTTLGQRCEPAGGCGGSNAACCS